MSEYEVWAIESIGAQPERRFAGRLESAIDEATLIARATSLSKRRGAVSVWVEDEHGTVCWAAGRKARGEGGVKDA